MTGRRPFLGAALLIMAGASAVVAGLAALGWAVGGAISREDAEVGSWPFEFDTTDRPYCGPSYRRIEVR